MESTLNFSGIWGIILIALVVLTVCMPFFIYKIRNQVVSMNNKLSRIVQLLEAQAPEAETSASVPRVEIDEKGRKIKICPKCGGKNRAEKWKCVHCGEPLVGPWN